MFAKSEYASKYTNEIRDILERLCRWSHGLGLESFEFVQVCDAIGANSLNEQISSECLLGSLEASKNELLYSIDHNLFTKKLRMALKLNASNPPAFKTIALLFSSSATECNNVALVNEIQQVLLELAIIYYPDDFKKYQTVFAKSVSWTLDQDIPMGRRFSFVSSTMDMFISYSILYEQCSKYKQTIEESERRNTQLLTAQSDNNQTRNDQIAFIAELEKKLSDRKHDINCLRGESDDLMLQLQSSNEKCKELEDIHKLSEHTISTLSEANQKLQSELLQRDTIINDLKEQYQQLLSSLHQEQNNNTEERKRLAVQFTEFKRRSMVEKAAVCEELAVSNLKLKQSTEEVSKLKVHFESMEGMLKKCQSEVHNLKCQLELRDEQLRQRRTEFVDVDRASMNSALSDLIDLISDRDEFVTI